ncbi:MAG: type II toxin-antitoxin system prevent-host-death family antitoxin [Caldilineaceae bacterium]
MSPSKTMSSEEARLSWREILDAAAAGDDVTIHRHRKPTAVLISYEDYIALADELDELRGAAGDRDSRSRKMIPTLASVG